jgi:integrase
MKRMKFTDKKIKSLKPKEKRYIVWEENAHGQGTLGLRVSPSGRKSWVIMFFFDDNPRMSTLKHPYPRTSVAEAHKIHAEYALALQRGEDPGAKAVAYRKAYRKSATVKDLAEIYIEKWAKPNKKSWRDDERRLEADVIPAWGRRKARNITKRDVIELLDEIVERGAPIAANRTLALVRKMFNFAVSRDIVPVNPCTSVPAPSKEHRRERVLDEAEIRQLLKKLPEARMAELSQLAIKLQLLTAQRCGEVLGAEWDDISLEFGWWTIPAEKSKNNLAHRVPLSSQARDVLQRVKVLNRGESHAFPSPRGDRPMTHTVLSRAVRRNSEVFGVDNWTPHDLRRTAASQITSMGFNRLVVSKILNHAERGVTAVYDRHSYDAEKREALEAWGSKIEELETKPATLVQVVEGGRASGQKERSKSSKKRKPRRVK